MRHIICCDCGAKRYFKHPAAGHSTIRCVECQAAYHKESMKGWRKRNPNAKSKYDKVADLDRRAHCKSRNSCLDKYSYFNSMPCKDCVEYECKEILIDGYAIRFDYSVRSRHGGIVFV